MCYSNTTRLCAGNMLRCHTTLFLSIIFIFLCTVQCQQLVPSTIVLDSSAFTDATRNLTETMERMTVAIQIFSAVMNTTIPKLTDTMDTKMTSLSTTLNTTIGVGLTKSINAMTVTLETQVAAMTVGLNSTSTTINMLSSGIRVLSTDLVGVVSSSTVLSNRISGLQSDMGSFNTKMGDLNTQMGDLNTNLVDLQVTTNGLMSRAEQQITSVQTTIDDTIVPQLDSTKQLVSDAVSQTTAIVHGVMDTGYSFVSMGLMLVTAILLTFIVLIFMCSVIPCTSSSSRRSSSQRSSCCHVAPCCASDTNDTEGKKNPLPANGQDSLLLRYFDAARQNTTSSGVHQQNSMMWTPPLHSTLNYTRLHT